MTNPLFDLTGKTAVVTGGSGVLGRAMCAGLAQAGARIVLLARNPEKLAAQAEILRAQGADVTTVSADVLDLAALKAAAEQIGHLDILVNIAGGNHPNATTLAGERAFFDLPADALKSVFDLNLLGTILPCQVFGRVMAAQKHGVIVNISSMASIRPLTRVVGYSAAKAAVNNFTQWLAVHMATEYAPEIRVNAIAPGFFVGEQNRYLLLNPDNTLTPRGEQIIGHTPMRRFGDPDDLVGTLVWLTSDASRFVTGIIVPVDGGFNAFGGV